ncbi:DNA polymerase III subunit chi [Sulfitobacter sp. S190]|uniref:DNA polymerase III subunit chi n=1 Tax=Sulfitobacter sp. S190 TaxID=2867022 RepID=UPI0021A76B99|nr:DNA polymerase III subunit chi [Sulfitobacter sp. S190]UWR24152.1 DNA polymerase III subunit chi [Sulfitobacter sp. S190]
MGAAMFYHLTQRPLVDTLRMLLEKSLANGWRVAVRGTDTAALEQLDEALWLRPEDGFLPHGMAGGPHDAQQPVLMGTGDISANGAQCLMVVHAADVSAPEVAAFERVCILFDGHDEAALGHARSQWKTLTGAGASAQYWSEESGRWEKKAQS